MGKLIGIAIGAGVTSAVLFVVATTASIAGLLLAYLAPLPLMIAGLGFTHLAGGIAALVAGGTVGLALGPIPGLFFAVSLGLPGWYLARLAMLGRPVSGAEQTPTIEWYPVSQLLLRLAGLASLTVLLAGIAVVLRYHGYDHAVATLARSLAVVFGGDALPVDVSFERIVEVLPFAMAASTTLMLSFNLWLAARIVEISGRLTRPWPVLPDAIRLPRPAAAALILVAVAGYLVPGALGVAARVPAAALGVLFIFEGLAAAHVLTRGIVARRTILAGVYLTTVFLLPWPLLALAVLGCIDCVASLRGSGIKIIKRPRS